MKQVLLMIACIAIVLSMNAQTVKVSSAGNVGIGVTPSYKLDVNGMGCFRFGSNGNIIMGTYNNTVDGIWGTALAIYGIQNNNMYTPGLYIGTPENKVSCVYSYSIYYQNLYQSSDMRLKENIVPCSSYLAKLKNIQTYTYTFTDEYFKDIFHEQKKRMQKNRIWFFGAGTSRDISRIG